MTGYEPRTYRDLSSGDDLIASRVVVRETDLLIRADRDVTDEAERLVRDIRGDLERFIDAWPIFQESFVPVDVPDTAPEIARRMAGAGRAAGVGPMAAVAGAIAEEVGRSLMRSSRAVIVENGGDIFLASPVPRDVLLVAGSSPLSGKVAFRVGPDEMPLGVCTSAGTVGHSTSLGRADAATVFSPDTALADAVATALGNRASAPEDIEAAFDWALSVPGVTGAAVVIGENMGVRGAVTLAPPAS
jgi:hypothetical protein